MKTNKELQLLQMYADECFKVFGTKVFGTKDMVDYCVKKVSAIIELPEGGLFVFEKPAIKTRFCFGEDGGESYKRACNMAYNVARTEKYFMNANLRDIDARIALLEGKYPDGRDGRDFRRLKRMPYMESDKIWDFLIVPVSCQREFAKSEIERMEQLTPEDTKALIALFKSERAKFEKRLKTYWKRYGASKLKTWTYWANA